MRPHRSISTPSRRVRGMTTYLAQTKDKTKVTKLLGLSWSAVGSIVERVIAERLDTTRFDGAASIGIDEFSYRKRVIWTGVGRGHPPRAPSSISLARHVARRFN